MDTEFEGHFLRLGRGLGGLGQLNLLHHHGGAAAAGELPAGELPDVRDFSTSDGSHLSSAISEPSASTFDIQSRASSLPTEEAPPPPPTNPGRFAATEGNDATVLEDLE